MLWNRIPLGAAVQWVQTAHNPLKQPTAHAKKKKKKLRLSALKFLAGNLGSFRRTMALRHSNFPHIGFNSQFFSLRSKKSPLAQIYPTKKCRQKGRTDFFSKAWGLQVLSKTIWGANSQPTHFTTLIADNRTESSS